MTKKQGFTLIELVVVIVILGILAVIAAPRFLNLQSDARKARLEATKGALESAFQIFSAKAQVPSADITVSDSGEKTLTLNGFEFGLTDDFYPKLTMKVPSDLTNPDQLLSIVNLESIIDESNYTFDPYNGGFIIHYGISDYGDSRCLISYAPDKFHNNDVTSDVTTNGYFYVISDGC